MSTVPTYDQFIEPILKVLAQHPEGLKTAEAYQHVADDVGLTQAQREVLLPSGRQPTYQNRIGWAYYRLKLADLGVAGRRGHWALTDEGRAFMDTHPNGLSEAEIKQIAQLDINSQDTPKTPGDDSDGAMAFQTPSEAIDWAIEALHMSVADDLLQFVLDATPEQFEVLVLDVLLAMGYGASRRDLTHVGGSGDGGIDGIITLDRLGLEKVYVQAKRWKPGNTVGSPDIQSFYGALAMKKASKGVFITTSSFTRPAEECAAQLSNGIVLVDGALLTQLMIEYGVGVSTQRVVKIVRVDSDYFEEL